MLSSASNLLGLVLPLALLQVYDRILPSAEYGTALSLFLVVAVAILMDGVLRMARARALARAAILAQTREHISTAHALLMAPAARVAALDPGARRGAFDAVARAQDAAGVSIRLARFDLPFALVFLALVWFIGGTLVFIPLAILLGGAVVCVLIARWQRRASLARMAAEQATRTRMGDLLAGLLDLKGFGLAGRLLGRVDAALRAKARATERAEHAASLLLDGLQVASVAATLAITLAGALWVVRGELTTGGLAACSLLAGRAVGAGLGVFAALARRGLMDAAGEQLAALRTALGPAPAPLPVPAKGLVLRLAAPGDAAPLSLAAGQILALPAAQDALLRAAAGDAPPPGGVLERAGAAVFVPAQPVLFRGSILDNLTGWDPMRAARAGQIAKELGLSGLVDPLPEGLRTPVGAALLPELSAGLIKRIALVRALAGDAALLVLERPEEGLDVEGRRRLAALLRAEPRSVLMVTQDPALLALATPPVGEIAA